jgi:hypothetical protein
MTLETCKSIYKNMKFNIYFIRYVKTNSKWIKDLILNIKTAKNLENMRIFVCFYLGN